ncbi:MAG: hypothetical protein ABSG37_10145 [Candidatus Limnocylindrales bacterium]|jgi:hypothetical protein
MAPAPVAALTGEAVPATRGPSRFPDPLASLRGRVAPLLFMRPSVSVDRLGYLTATLLAIVFALGAVLVLAVMPAATNLLQNANPATAVAQLGAGERGGLKVLSAALVVAGLLTLLCFSVFLGLTTHNAAGLGVDGTMLTPYRAGTCWAGVLWAQVRVALALTAPAVLIWRGYTIPGLLVAVAVMEIARPHIDDSFGWLSGPSRHLSELYVKLGPEGSTWSPAASMWSACFRVANLTAIAVSTLPLMLLAAPALLGTAGGSAIPGWQSTGLGPTQLVVALVVGSFVASTAAAVALSIPVTLGLARRQRIRGTFILPGRGQGPAVSQGEDGQARAASTPPATYSTATDGDAIDEDRIVERLPLVNSLGFATPPGGRPQLGDPGSGARGLRALRYGDLRESRPGFANLGRSMPEGSGPAQASLYSPSTTSSFSSGALPAEPD